MTDYTEQISPHPVPLPMGEGTLEQSASVCMASPLPWGEGQGEGWDPRTLREAPRTQRPLMAVIMPGEPSHGVLRRRNRWPGRNERALHHHDRQAERAGGFDLGDRCVAAGVLGQNNLDAVLAEQADVVLRREGAARLDEDDVRQSERRLWAGRSGG